MAELVEEIQSACDEKGQDSSSVLSHLDEVVGQREVLSFCVSQGPLPSFPATLVDIFLLTGSAIINVEITGRGVSWGVIKLDHLSSISMRPGKDDFLSFGFETTAGHTWGLEFRRGNERDARDFVEAVKEHWLS